MITFGVICVALAWAQTLYYARELGRTRTALRMATDAFETLAPAPYRIPGRQEQLEPAEHLLDKQAYCIKCDGAGIGRTYVKDSLREVIIAKCLCGAQWCEKVKS